MGLLDNETLISGFMDFLFIFIFSLLGAIIKDTYNTFTSKDNKVKISRILISSVVSSVLLFSLSEYILVKISYKLFILPCFVGGMIGFEVLGKIKNLSFWINAYSNNRDVIKKIINSNMKDNDIDKN